MLPRWYAPSLGVGNKECSQNLCHHGLPGLTLDKTLPAISKRRNDQFDTRTPHNQCKVLLTDIYDVAVQRKPCEKEAVQEVAYRVVEYKPYISFVDPKAKCWTSLTRESASSNQFMNSIPIVAQTTLIVPHRHALWRFSFSESAIFAWYTPVLIFPLLTSFSFCATSSVSCIKI